MIPRHRNRNASGGGKEAIVDLRIAPFTEFSRNLPKSLSQLEVEKLFNGTKPNINDAKQLLDKLLRCLQSQNPSTQTDAFVTLVILLSLNNHLKTDDVLNAINEILVTDGDNTRGERRVVYAARVLSLGALVRSKRVGSMNHKALNNILAQFVSLAEKRTSILILAAPFISEFLSSVNLKQQKKLDMDPVQTLLSNSSKQQIPSLFKISLTAFRLNLGLSSSLMESIDSICETVAGFVKHKDKECLNILFQYLLSTKKTKEFWKLFSSKIGSYHFDLLHACIVAAVEAGCPLKHIVRRGVIMPLVGLLRSVDDHESLTKAKAVFRLLLDWDPDSSKTKMNPKARQAAIRLFFEEANLSADYFFLHHIFRRFITFLTSEELDLLYSICQPLTSINVHGGNATLNFLSRIPPLKCTSGDTRFKIAIELFENGFCESMREVEGTETKNYGPNVLAMRKKVSREGFESIIKSTYDTEFIENVFKHIKHVGAGKMEGTILEKPASEEDLTNLRIITKLLKKMNDEEMKNILRVYGIYTIVDSSIATVGLDTLVPICEKGLTAERRERAGELFGFIITAIREHKVIFPYETVYSRLLKEKTIQADSVQLLINIIDTEMDRLDDEDDDDDSDDDDDDDDESDASDSKNIDVGLAQNLENGFESRINGEEDDNENENSGEESIDMDEASETELEKMDAALANVFSTKKKMKEGRKMEENLTIRALNLIQMFLRRYKVAEDGAVPLMLISPCITLLLKSTKTRKVEIQSRISSVVKSLNAIRRISSFETFEKTLIENVIADIEVILQKKLPKTVRSLVRGTLAMVQRCFKIHHQPQPEQSKKDSTKRKSEGNHHPTKAKTKKSRSE